VAYSDRRYADQTGGLWVGDFGQAHYEDLAWFWKWHRDEFGLTDEVYPEPIFGWRAGVDSVYRLTSDQWANFNGLTAHGAVPLNTHWDTGLLRLEKIWNIAREEELMPKQQWDMMIEALFVGRPDKFQGDPNYWKQLDPDSPEWVDFFNAFVEAISNPPT
jgi:hypothetical protein